MDNKVEYLNQIIVFKNNKKSMPTSAYESEKVILVRTINDAIKLAEEVKPTPFSLINDLRSLIKQL